MRRPIIKLSVVFGALLLFGCEQNSAEAKRTKLKKQVIQQYAYSRNLGWDVPKVQRFAQLIMDDQPMGYVMVCYIFLKINETDEQKSVLQLTLDLEIPGDVFKSADFSLMLDGTDYKVVDQETQNEGEITDWYRILFEVKLSDFMKAKNVHLKMNNKHGLLFDDKSDVDKKMLDLIKTCKEKARLMGGLKFRYNE